MENKIAKVLELKKSELERLEEDALRYTDYIQSLETPYDLAFFGKDKMDRLIETQAKIEMISQDIRMLEYLLKA